MSNIAGKAYAMNVLTPIRPWKTRIQIFFFMLSRCRPSTLCGLLGLKLIHFARWVIIPRDAWPDLGQPGGPPRPRNDAMLFLSNFNGTWDQYIDAFADGIPSGLDLFWYTSTKYPHSIPIAAFKDYITHNQVDTNAYYNATPGAAQRDIKRALRVRLAIQELARVHVSGDAAAFARAWREQLVARGVQNCLGSHGYAPTASVSTEKADLRRADYLRESARPDWAAPPPGSNAPAAAPAASPQPADPPATPQLEPVK